MVGRRVANDDKRLSNNRERLDGRLAGEELVGRRLANNEKRLSRGRERLDNSSDGLAGNIKDERRHLVSHSESDYHAKKSLEVFVRRV